MQGARDRKTRITTNARTPMIVMIVALVAAGCSSTTGPEEPTTLVTFDAAAGQLPEGVTVDASGNVFASLSPLGQLVKIPAGSEAFEMFGRVEGLAEGDFGLIGITTDQDGNVYGGVFSMNTAAHGVWRFDASTGDATHLPGSEALGFPNAVVVDGTTVYITDTTGPDGKGAIWRVPEDGEAAIWAQSDLLAGDGSAGFGFPIGPNGIDVHDGAVIVGTTETATLVSIPIESDGSAGEATLLADLSSSGPEGAPINVDGIDVAADGSVYIAAPILHSVVKWSADGQIETLATADDDLDAPTSVALHDGVLYTCNFSAALGEISNGIGPSLVYMRA